MGLRTATVYVDGQRFESLLFNYRVRTRGPCRHCFFALHTQGRSSRTCRIPCITTDITPPMTGCRTCGVKTIYYTLYTIYLSWTSHCDLSLEAVMENFRL